VALHRAGQAGAERIRGIVHRAATGRAAQRDPVSLVAARTGRTRGLARRLQRRATTFAARLDDPIHLRRHHRPAGHYQPPDSNSDWIRKGGDISGRRLLRCSIALAFLGIDQKLKCGRVLYSDARTAFRPRAGWAD
jgi:hypothetical protein